MSPELRTVLRHAGISQRKMESLKLNDRLLHDLGIYGEMAENMIDALAQMNVDMSDFPIWNFFPEEYPGDSIFSKSLLWFFRPFTWLRNDYSEFPPLTLADVERWIQSGRWRRSRSET